MVVVHLIDVINVHHVECLLNDFAKPQASPLLSGKGIGRAWRTQVVCHASWEPRNEWNNSQLLSVLRRAQQRGSAESCSSAWRASPAIPTGRCPVTLDTHPLAPTVRHRLMASDAWAGTMILTRCHVNGGLFAPGSAQGSAVLVRLDGEPKRRRLARGEGESNRTLCGGRYFALSSLELYKLLVASGGLSCSEERPQLPRSRTIYSTSQNLASLPLSGGGDKQKPPALHTLCLHFISSEEEGALLRYAVTLKWRVSLTRLFSLMSSSPNPSMIHLLPTPSLKWGSLQNSYWLKRIGVGGVLGFSKQLLHVRRINAAVWHDGWMDFCAHTSSTCRWPTVWAHLPHPTA